MNPTSLFPRVPVDFIDAERRFSEIGDMNALDPAPVSKLVNNLQLVLHLKDEARRIRMFG